MRGVLLQFVALLLTVVAWGTDVVHMMHLGEQETVLEHDATTGDEEPDTSRTDATSDEVAIADATDRVTDRVLACTFTGAMVERPASDEHSDDLMRPPRPRAA